MFRIAWLGCLLFVTLAVNADDGIYVCRNAAAEATQYQACGDANTLIIDATQIKDHELVVVAAPGYPLGIQSFWYAYPATTWQRWSTTTPSSILGICADPTERTLNKCAAGNGGKSSLQLRSLIVGAIVLPPPPVVIPVEVKKPLCYPWPFGTGTSWIADTVSPRGGNYLAEDAVVAYRCNDTFQYWSYCYGGNVKEAAKEKVQKYRDGLTGLFLGGSRTAMDDALLSTLTRNQTAAESAVCDDLWSQIPMPDLLWTVKPNGTNTTRIVYQNVAGKTGKQLGTVAIVVDGKAQVCRCTNDAMRIANSSSTYCSIEGLRRSPFELYAADAVTICVNKP